MKNFDDNVTCEKVRDLLDAFLDGDLDPSEAALMESHFSGCKDCSRELELAKSVQNALHSLPEKECPERVVQTTLEKMQLKERVKTEPGQKPHFFPDLLKWRWIAGAVAALLLLVIGLSLLRKPPQQSREYFTPEQLDKARMELEFTFACIGSIGCKSAAAVYNDIVEDKVVPSVKKAIEETIETKVLPYKKDNS